MLLLSTAVTAEVRSTATDSFTRPTTRVSGDALLDSDIAGFNIYLDKSELPMSSTNVIPSANLQYTLPANATSLQFLVEPGDHIYTITTIDTEGRESTPSFEVGFTVPILSPDLPNAPIPAGKVIIKIVIFPTPRP